MKIDHIAIWTDNIENLKAYYLKYFEGTAFAIYTNSSTGLSSYFFSFQSL